MTLIQGPLAKQVADHLISFPCYVGMPMNTFIHPSNHMLVQGKIIILDKVPDIETAQSISDQYPEQDFIFLLTK